MTDERRLSLQATEDLVEMVGKSVRRSTSKHLRMGVRLLDRLRIVRPSRRDTFSVYTEVPWPYNSFSRREPPAEVCGVATAMTRISSGL